MTTPNNAFPANWLIGQDFDPNQHLLNLKGQDYLTVQNRLLWFVRDQRALIVAGVATMPYRIETELVTQDRDAGYAQFKTRVRDVLGNEATMYGSETARDFPDYAEKASTKSVGRALAMLGYGTGNALDLDEGERIVDAPVARRQQAPAAPTPQRSWSTLRQRAVEVGIETMEDWTALVQYETGKKDSATMNLQADYDAVAAAIEALQATLQRTAATYGRSQIGRYTDAISG